MNARELNRAQVNAVHAIAQAISNRPLADACQRALDGGASFADSKQIFAAYASLTKAITEVR